MKPQSDIPVTKIWLNISMNTFPRLLLAVAVLGSLAWVQGQGMAVQKNGRDSVQQGQLKKLMAKVGVEVPEADPRGDQRVTGRDQSQSYRELKIRLTDPTKSGELKPAFNTQEQLQAPSASIVEDKKRLGALPHSRSLELSPTQIFIAAVDATNKLRWWSIVPDPRVVRSETQSPTGGLRGEEYYATNVTFVVAFPDDPEIANLRFYHPVWNGTDFDLKPLTNVPTR